MSIDHVPGTTTDAQEELLAQLRDLVPAAFVDGDLDAGALLDTLELAKPDKPAFSFSWPGIEQARADARAATTATLAPDEASSVNWESARNILVEGDNLQVLKLLKNGYRGQAKLIYIDPPFPSMFACCALDCCNAAGRDRTQMAATEGSANPSRADFCMAA